jgi:hypothetical protein
MAEGFVFPCFYWSYGLPVMSGSCEVVSSNGWLVSSIWFLCPQGRLQLGPVVAHYQFVQGGPICCFYQAAAAVSYSCNSDWSAPSPERWDNSVFCTTLSARILAQ